MTDDRGEGAGPQKPADPKKPASCYSFKQLAALEDRWLNSRTPEKKVQDLQQQVPASEPAGVTIVDEPFVSFTNRDRFGLALSGGGIRSASFNLGLLQALRTKGVLKHVDYLTTVSGGGYIGGFWSALRRKANRAVPEELGERSPGESEPAPVRHLREFSRFLVPRTGFTHAETWAAVVAVLGGLLPTLILTLAVVTLAFGAWLGAVHVTLDLPSEDAAKWFAIATFVIVVVAEAVWAAGEKSGKAAATIVFALILTLFVAAGTAVAWEHARADLIPKYLGGLTPLEWKPPHLDAPQPSWLPGWLQGGVVLHARHQAWVLQALMPAFCWLAVGVVLLLLHAVFSRARAFSRALSRTSSRLFAPAVIWVCLVAIWWFARWLFLVDPGATAHDNADVPTAAGVTAGTAMASGGLFVWLRDWLKREPKETNAGNLLTRVAGLLKPLAPQLLAVAGVLAVVTLFTGLVIHFVARNYAPLGLGIAFIIVLTTLIFFDPATVGLHDFYRSRIARCFLGASQHVPRPETPADRPSEEQDGDDFAVADLEGVRHGPLHLVCCAANNLGGDALGSLYRGARSAVVSPLAVSVGGFAAPPPKDLSFSSVLTASGAAFNSQMGAISMQLGPSVAILMTMLNLRLGLWVQHPLAVKRSGWKGLAYFREALARTFCEPVSAATAKKLLGLGGPDDESLRLDELPRHLRRKTAMHLSDGGHFENLGLYELVRRHCRYIIVSDASADPEAAFDDLGNAIRRVREDFGVEIDLDVGALRPNDGMSKQHVAVGTIHYDTLGGTDKGTIIYFKPTLVGDEPTDVTQYRSRNARFPHESTADQFYDEAQWESYRRLGEHEASAVLRFVDVAKQDNDTFIDNLFLDARQRWQRGGAVTHDAFLELTARCSEIESQLLENAPPALAAELFPEVGWARTAAPPGAAPPGPPVPPDTSDAETDIQALYWMMQIAQVMEDVWLGAELDLYWSHPLNEGWMNYFSRWAATPSFRRWWPVLRPIYSAGFRDFVRDRFKLGLSDEAAREERYRGIDSAKLEISKTVDLDGYAAREWVRRAGPEVLTREGRTLVAYELRLLDRPGPIQVGLFSYADNQGVREWTPDDLFVPPSLLGGGIVARFLDRIVKELGNKPLRVTLPNEKTHRDPATRNQRVRDVSFYKSRGFVYQSSTQLERRGS
jgi:hypothetical protein